MQWTEFYERAAALTRASFYVRVAALGAFLWTVIVAANTIIQMRDESWNFGFGGEEPGLFEYAYSVSGSTITYGIITAILFATGYILKAAGLLAEIAVFDLDIDEDEEDGDVDVVDVQA